MINTAETERIQSNAANHFDFDKSFMVGQNGQLLSLQSGKPVYIGTPGTITLPATNSLSTTGDLITEANAVRTQLTQVTTILKSFGVAL